MSRRPDLREEGGALWLDNICCVPSIHGRAAFAREVRKLFLAHRFDVVAVELPPSLQKPVREAANALPNICAVTYREPEGTDVYVPMDPCDSIIEAIRLAQRERTRLELIDAEVPDFQGGEVVLPDEYALTRLGLPRFYRAIERALPPTGPQGELRERHMAHRLQDLSTGFERVLFVSGLAHLPGIVRYFRAGSRPAPRGTPPPENVEIRTIHPDSLYFVLGELPYTTYLYERQRSALTLDEFEKVDAIKELIQAARDEHHQKYPDALDHVSPSTLRTLLVYARNLTLQSGRLTPSLYYLAVAARGVAGNELALQLMETAKFYPFLDPLTRYPTLETTGRRGRIDDEVVDMKNRLPGLAKEWKRLKLERPPEEEDKQKWRTLWDPYRSCSWPPEDEIIEGFTAHVRRRALQVVGQSQMRQEEFVTSLKDGIDLRQTLRDHHLGKIWVKEEPVVRGRVGAVVFIFEETRDDERYPWRSTWQAEHQNESTLAFYATDFREDLVGPGVARSEYGGAMFLFPPIPIFDIWSDPRFDGTRNAMERLTLAALHYAQERYVAYVAAKRPTPWMRAEARERGRHLVFLPISSFSPTTLRKLRRFHVLNGSEVRSWAQKFIR
ncbi:MAG: hypothetical protein RL885_31405 [Planctomycetota bacterium]